MSDILLVCMPFGSLFSPSLGLSLLKAALSQRQISTRIQYFSIDFAERFGQDFYWRVACDGGPAVECLTGDWIFSAALFGLPSDSGDSYLNEVLLRRGTVYGRRPQCSPAFVRRLREIRQRIPAFLDACAEAVVAEQPRIVGFTSVFQQHVASLALAQAIKRRCPDIFIVFGGANCEGIMGAETLRQFAFVDAVVSGEGEATLPELARLVLASAPVDGLPGVRVRGALDREFDLRQFQNAPIIRDLDALPYAEYDDYFAQFDESRLGRHWQPSVTFETSRGCWWGERMHCTFCGLNGTSMTYRRKSPPRALHELERLADRHPNSDIEVVDNILDMEYFKSFLPTLAKRRPALNLFYETKSNLKKQHVRVLRDAGVRRIQPGIESFSDQVLKLMKKGVSGLHNIQLLKWCKEFGVTADWNFLWGFPGEPPDEYARMAQLVPLLTHLRPPTAFTSIRLDRFSPNFCEPEKYGLVDIHPMPSYRHIYPLLPEAVENLAYYFTFGYAEPRSVDAYVGRLEREIGIWQKVTRRADLFAVDVQDRLVIWDLRPCGSRPVIVLDGVERLVYLACDAISTLEQLTKVPGIPLHSANVEAISQVLARLVANGLMLKEGDRYLALAVIAGEYSPCPAVTDMVHSFARLIGQDRSGECVIPLANIEQASWRLPLFKRTAYERRSRKVPLRERRRSALQFSLTDRGELSIR